MHPSGHGYSKAKAFFKGYKGCERSWDGYRELCGDYVGIGDDYTKNADLRK